MQATLSPGHSALILVAVLVLLFSLPLSAQEVPPAADPVLYEAVARDGTEGGLRSFRSPR